MKQGSEAEIMYPDLCKGLTLKLKDLSRYDTPLVRFNGKTITLRGMIRLPAHMGKQVVNMDFIAVEAYSPYTAIQARPRLYTLGDISSTLLVKLKNPTKEGVGELIGCQVVAKYCMVVAIRHQASEIGSLESTPTS